MQGKKINKTQITQSQGAEYLGEKRTAKLRLSGRLWAKFGRKRAKGRKMGEKGEKGRKGRKRAKRPEVHLFMKIKDFDVCMGSN